MVVQLPLLILVYFPICLLGTKGYFVAYLNKRKCPFKKKKKEKEHVLIIFFRCRQKVTRCLVVKKSCEERNR